MKKLLAAWLCLAIAACAASHKATMAPTEAQPSAAHAGAPVSEPTTPEQKRARITELSQQISTQQSNAPSAPTPMSAGSQACTDVCTIKTTICDNARQICKLADELQPDDWATGKCNDANQACTDATKRCDDCGQ
jgi:hypothetical protein